MQILHVAAMPIGLCGDAVPSLVSALDADNLGVERTCLVRPTLLVHDRE